MEQRDLRGEGRRESSMEEEEEDGERELGMERAMAMGYFVGWF